MIWGLLGVYTCASQLWSILLVIDLRYHDYPSSDWWILRSQSILAQILYPVSVTSLCLPLKHQGKTPSSPHPKMK